MGIKSAFEKDWGRIKAGSNTLLDGYRDYDSKHPKTTTVVVGTLALIKWLVVLVVALAVVFWVYDAAIEQPQREAEQRAGEEQRRVLTQQLEEERMRPRRDCLARLGVPDRGQLILPSDCW